MASSHILQYAENLVSELKHAAGAALLIAACITGILSLIAVVVYAGSYLALPLGRSIVSAFDITITDANNERPRNDPTVARFVSAIISSLTTFMVAVYTTAQRFQDKEQGGGGEPLNLPSVALYLVRGTAQGLLVGGFLSLFWVLFQWLRTQIVPRRNTNGVLSGTKERIDHQC